MFADIAGTATPGLIALVAASLLIAGLLKGVIGVGMPVVAFPLLSMLVDVQTVSIRRRPQASYLSPSERLSSVGSSLYILMRSIRFSIPKSVNAITPSSPTP